MFGEEKAQSLKYDYKLLVYYMFIHDHVQGKADLFFLSAGIRKIKQPKKNFFQQNEYLWPQIHMPLTCTHMLFCSRKKSHVSVFEFFVVYEFSGTKTTREREKNAQN